MKPQVEVLTADRKTLWQTGKSWKAGLASSHLLPSGGLDYKAKGFVFVQRAVGTVPSDRLGDGPGRRVPELAVPGPPFSDANASEAAGHAGEQLRSHCSLGCHCDNSAEQPHSLHHLCCHSSDSTLNGKGPRPLAVYDNPAPLAGLWAVPEETTGPAGNQDEELLEVVLDVHLSIGTKDTYFGSGDFSGFKM
ncbi:putative uncharacterized protein C6orf52 homolog isoform X2 [Mesocricetus auratus]|uniref:Uncharacterized protein n=1 Tax=Mesocricetus auratus TaxID=10036 RepID=A0ABM2YAF8_MESAU|nr:putative uncharacterized protein C6orf52 homolog isoform X2 [Mesocricetus auratus]